MRMLSLTVVALASLSAGCSSTGNQVGPTGMPLAQNVPGVPPAQQATYPGGPQQAGFTQKVAAAFTTNPFAQGGALSSGGKKELDPIALGYNSGPTTPDMYTAMAEMADRGGSTDQARQFYSRALEADKNNLKAIVGWARLEDREGNLDQALGLYQRAAAAHPQDPTALNDLGLCYARRGDLQKSLQLLDQAVRIDPAKALYRNNIAKVLVETNRLDHAIAHMAAVHGPAAAQYNVAVLLSQRGRQAEAVKHLNTALGINPQLQAARVLLSELAPSQPVTNRVVATPGVVPAQGQPQQGQPMFGVPQVASLSPQVPAGPALASQQQPVVNIPGSNSATPVGYQGTATR